MKEIAIESCVIEVDSAKGTLSGTVDNITSGKSISVFCENKAILLDETQVQVSNCSNESIEQASGIISFKATTSYNIENKLYLRKDDEGSGTVIGVQIGSSTPGSFTAYFKISDAGQLNTISN